MAMNVGADAEDEIMSEINTTPLVDVMLVLLIIFLITIPVVTTSIKVDLPKEKNVVRETKPENVIISVNAAGKIFLYDTPIKNSDDLFNRMKITKFMRSWTFGNDNPRLMLHHVNDVLTDESWGNFLKLHPTISEFIIERMNSVLEYNG